MRAQFQGLKALLDAIQSISAAQVDGVTTVSPIDPAAVSVAVIGNTLHFTFSIPQGVEGLQGNAGTDGAQGPPFANAVVDAVSTLNPGDAASVSVSFDGSNVHFTFGIPRGDVGPQGAPGEVTSTDLVNAISGTSNNTNGVTTLDTPFADPDMEAMRQKLNELLLAARR